MRDTGELSSPCGASPVFTDKFSAASAPGSGYTTFGGTWVRGTGSYTVTWPSDANGARAYALLGGAFNDLDVTLEGHSVSGDGFGLVYATTGTGDGYAVMVHPGEYHGVYLKRLVPGANDVNIASATLPTTIAPDALFSLHVTRVAGVVHVTLTSAALPSPVTLTGSEEGPPNEGRMGLVWSPTTSDTGAVFTDVVVTSATCPSAATDGGAMDAGADTGVPGPLEPYSNGPSAPGPGPNNANGQPWTIAFDEEWNGTYGNDRRTDLGGWTAEHWGYPFTETKNGTLNAGSNVWVQGGLLNLATTGSNGTQGSGTGGYVSTCITDGAVTPFDFTHGYFEAYVFLPGSGATIDNWPAWWAVGDNINWPSGGEIDVAEGLGTNCWHWHDPSGGPGGCPSGSFGGTWHYYGASWYPSGSGQGVTWYYDGISVGSLTSSIASHEMCLILENDNGGGGPTVDSVMQVDYVRLWQ